MGQRLRERVAIITGGASGIGEATARLFAAEGARLVLVDQDGERAAMIAAEIEQAGGQALALRAAVEREDEWERIAQATVARFGAIHSLIGCAGMRVWGPIDTASEASWDAIWAVNVKALAFGARAVAPHIEAAGGGTLVFVASANAEVGRGGMAQYDTTKAAVLGLTRSLACDLWPRRIRVNAVNPGPTLTRFHILRAEARGDDEATLRERVNVHSIMRRWGEPAEIAYGILFLAGDESSFVTGIALPVDGGYSVI